MKIELYKGFEIYCITSTPGFFVKGFENPKKGFPTIDRARKEIDSKEIEVSESISILDETGKRYIVKVVGLKYFSESGECYSSYRTFYVDNDNNRKIFNDINKFKGKIKLIEAQITDMLNHLNKHTI